MITLASFRGCRGVRSNPSRIARRSAEARRPGSRRSRAHRSAPAPQEADGRDPERSRPSRERRRRSLTVEACPRTGDHDQQAREPLREPSGASRGIDPTRDRLTVGGRVAKGDLPRCSSFVGDHSSVVVVVVRRGGIRLRVQPTTGLSLFCGWSSRVLALVDTKGETSAARRVIWSWGARRVEDLRQLPSCRQRS